MHDPYTVAFEIKSPIKRKCEGFKNGYRNTLITIWHVDPGLKGDDDSCGWFMRTKHGNQEVLKQIKSSFENDWKYWFNDQGDPMFSTHGIVLCMFRLAACFHFKYSHKNIDSFMKNYLYDILHFAENPIDSLSDYITNRYNTPKEERLNSLADCIYGWILRESRPWYKHPRWHFWHWEIKFDFTHPFLKMFKKCCACGRHFKYGEQSMGNWQGTDSWCFNCDSNGKATKFFEEKYKNASPNS